MSMIRTSLTSGGTRLVAVRMMSGMANACVAGQDPDVDPPVGGDLGVARGLDRVLEARRHLGEVEVHPRRQRLHVAAGDQRAEVPEDDAAEHVQAGVGAHQRGAALVLDGAADRGAGRRQRVVLGGDQVQVVALAGADDAGLHAAPQQHSVVGRLATAARVEGGAVQHDPVGPDASTTASHSRRVWSSSSSRWVRTGVPGFTRARRDRWLLPSACPRYSREPWAGRR